MIQPIRVFSSDIGMTFGLANCGIFIVNKSKVKSTGEITLPKSHIDDIGESYKYFGISLSFGSNDKDMQNHL